MGRALGRFAMLAPGDRIAVGVSGGKDSWSLLHALVAHRRRAPFSYDLVAVTIEQGKFKVSIEGLGPRIRDLGVEWVLREDPSTLALVAGRVVHGCDVCSRHRRRSLYTLAAELGCTVLALGHTADDCAEALGGGDGRRGQGRDEGDGEDEPSRRSHQVSAGSKTVGPSTGVPSARSAVRTSSMRHARSSTGPRSG